MPAPECRNLTCKFGSCGKPNRTDGPYDLYCVFHKSAADMQNYTPRQMSSLVRSVRSFTTSGRKDTVLMAYAALDAAVPGLGDTIRARVDRLNEQEQKKVKPPVKRKLVTDGSSSPARPGGVVASSSSSSSKSSSSSSSSSADSATICNAATASVPAGMCASSSSSCNQVRLPQECLNQGRFGLCSEFALAVCGSSTLLFKYNLMVEADSLLRKWLEEIVPDKAFWPDQMADVIPEIITRKSFLWFKMILHVTELRGYDDARRVVDKCVGFKCVAIVSQLQPQCNHSMAAMCSAPDGILCYNTWGDDCREPTLLVSRDAFVKAYFVDVRITNMWAPTHDADTAKHRIQWVAGEPDRTGMWKRMTGA